MKLAEYKESGILEAHVLGVLSPELEEQLLSDLETNVALRNELNRVEQSLSNFKRNFTRGEKTEKGEKVRPKKVQKAAPGKYKEQNVRIVVGIMSLVVVVMIFLFLSTQYQSTSYQSQLLETEEKVKELQLENTNQRQLIEDLQQGLLQLTTNEFNSRKITTAEGLQARYIVLEQHASNLLILSGLPDVEKSEYLQLWSLQNEEYRRTGMLSEESFVNDRSVVARLPKTNLELSLITIESDSIPRMPNVSRVVLQLGQ
nr:anti-sigma factor [Saprospiraceae bacterium]